MGVTQNSYIPRAWEVSDLKVSGATRPRPLNQILPSHLVYNYYLNYSEMKPVVNMHVMHSMGRHAFHIVYACMHAPENLRSCYINYPCGSILMQVLATCHIVT